MSFARSLTYALAGLKYGLRTQRHLRFHLLAAFMAICIGSLVGLLPMQWAVLTLTIAAVISVELINTAIEALVDLLSPDYHQKAKVAKDTAAAAVLVVSIAAVIVGLLIFWPSYR